jgi:ribokinase
MEQAHARGLRIAFNPSPIPENPSEFPLEYADILILNEIEGAVLAGLDSDGTDFRQILSALAARYPQAAIVLTLGSAGVLYQYQDEQASHPIFKVKAVDTTAAGDTFCGYFLSCLCSGKGASESLRIASAASAIAVSRPGAAPSIPVMSEVETFLSSQNHLDA